MDGQRPSSRKARRRRREGRRPAGPSVEPVLIAARRPNSPRIADTRPSVKPVASAKPVVKQEAPRPARRSRQRNRTEEPVAKRTARIVQLSAPEIDERETLRQRLLTRLALSEGRGAISKAANEYLKEGFDYPREQLIQLQLLEHFDESVARNAVSVLSELLSKEAAIKRPILEQRLRRLEEYADEPSTRESAAHLRSAIRREAERPGDGV